MLHIPNESALWHDVFDIHAVGEFDQTHFYVAGFCQITGSRHHAFQPRRVGGYQRRIATVGQLCLNNNFLSGRVDVGHEPKLINALAVGARRTVVDWMLRDWRTKSCRQAQYRKFRDDASFALSAEGVAARRADLCREEGAPGLAVAMPIAAGVTGCACSGRRNAGVKKRSARSGFCRWLDGLVGVKSFAFKGVIQCD
jgi:hypothetical protein